MPLVSSVHMYPVESVLLVEFWHAGSSQTAYMPLLHLLQYQH